MKNGAIDFLEKPFDDEVLIPLVQNALKKANSMFADQQQQEQIVKLYDSLSRREREVMALVVSGGTGRTVFE